MPSYNGDRVHLSLIEATDLSQRALEGAGYDGAEAAILTSHMVDAALCGYEYSGLPKILNVVDAPNFKQPRRPLRTVKETSVSALIDGGNQVGMLAIYHGTLDVIRRASEHGFAIVGVCDTWMSGRSAYYCEMIARAGLIAIHTASATPNVAPFGGASSALGTNPIAFGFPTESDPLIIDMGTSAFMASDLQFRERIGAPIPEGVALDEQGKPTTNAAAARRGTLLPFGGPGGGYKGFGLALAMDAMSVLCAGARDASDSRGYMLVAFKPDLFISLNDYKRDLSRRIAEIRATPRQDGVSEIRIPGERSYRDRARLAREGIEIDRMIYDELSKLAMRA